MPKAPIIADLVWQGGLAFRADGGGQTMTLDGESKSGPSPVQTLAYALASCMAADLAFILAKGRHAPRAIGAHLVGERAQSDPHRFVTIRLHFTVAGDVPADAIERALALSRETYCSVWHSMRQDIDFDVSFALNENAGS
jgi:putative redox protein